MFPFYTTCKYKQKPKKNTGFLVFYFTWKALFVLKIFKFLTWLFSQKNSLIKKITLISKFMTLQHAKQTIAIHTLPNILRGKGNETMKSVS